MSGRKATIAGLLLCGALSLSACGTPGASSSAGAPTPASVCGDIAAAKAAPDAAAQLGALDPHSALGVVWADAQSGCNGATPVAGVDASWTQQVWAMVKGLIPAVLPALVALI